MSKPWVPCSNTSDNGLYPSCKAFQQLPKFPLMMTESAAPIGKICLRCYGTRSTSLELELQHYSYYDSPRSPEQLGLVFGITLPPLSGLASPIEAKRYVGRLPFARQERPLIKFFKLGGNLLSERDDFQKSVKNSSVKFYY